MSGHRSETVLAERVVRREAAVAGFVLGFVMGVSLGYSLVLILWGGGR